MRRMLALLAVAMVMASCATSPPTGAPGIARHDQLTFTIDRSERRLYVRRGARLIRVHPVAVGTAEYPTPIGLWLFQQVDINPDWNPPPGREWTRDRRYTPPGHPDNPMGRARLIFDRPYTIHGTTDLGSLGRAASHGSIRIANLVAIELAALLLREGGSWRGSRWFRQMLADPTRMYPIRLARPVPIRIVE
jgi:lipoprotein-anchoring transpeptidase ErfK/SrfK